MTDDRKPEQVFMKMDHDPLKPLPEVTTPRPKAAPPTPAQRFLLHFTTIFIVLIVGALLIPAIGWVVGYVLWPWFQKGFGWTGLI
jgi:hypothetical protein